MKTTRPWWAWLVIPNLFIVLLATFLAVTNRLQYAILKQPGVDKFFHFTLWGGFAFFLVAFVPRRWAPWVINVLAVVAVLEEISQAAFPTRTFDLGDMAATLAGVFVLGRFLGNRAAHGMTSRSWRTCSAISSTTSKE